MNVWCRETGINGEETEDERRREMDQSIKVWSQRRGREDEGKKFGEGGLGRAENGAIQTNCKKIGGARSGGGGCCGVHLVSSEGKCDPGGGVLPKFQQRHPAMRRNNQAVLSLSDSE